MVRFLRASACVLSLAAVLAVSGQAGAARSSAGPVGPLPAGPVSTITTLRGQLVAVALPKSTGGKAWRLARAFDSKVVREVTETDAGSTVVIVFKATGTGRTTLVYGLTKGETAKAYAARRFIIKVT